MTRKHPKQQHPQTSGEGKPTPDQASGAAPVARPFVQIPDSIMEEYRTGQKQQHRDNRISRWITGAAVAGAWIYAAIALFQWCTMQSQTSIFQSELSETQKEFRASARARMIIGNEKGVPVELQDFGNKTQIVMHLRNDGHAAAHDVQIKFAAEVAPPDTTYQYSALNPAPGHYETGPTIGQGEPFDAYLALDQIAVTLVRNRTKGLRIVGRIIYWDEFGDYCEPIAYVTVPDPFRFESLFPPPADSVCSPQSFEGEVFSVNTDGTATVKFTLRKNEPPFHNAPQSQEQQK